MEAELGVLIQINNQSIARTLFGILIDSHKSNKDVYENRCRDDSDVMNCLRF